MHDIAVDVLERHAKGGSWLFDLETRDIFWSDGVYNLHGLTRQSYTPALDTALDFYTPESRVQLEAALDAALADGSGWSLTLDIVRADGQLRHVQTIGQVEVRNDRAPLLAGAILDVHDQTEERLKNQALERRLAEDGVRWRMAGENAGLGLIEIDFSTDTYRISGAFVQRTGLGGLDRLEVPRSEWLSWIHPEDFDSRQQLIEAQSSDPSQGYIAEYRLRPPDGTELWVKEAGRGIADDQSRIVGILSDIRERKESERALRHSRRRLGQTLQEAPIGIALVSPEGRWLTVNRSLCDMLGYDEPALLSTTFQQITHPDDLEADLANVQALLAGRIRAYRMEKRYYHRTGRIVDVQLDVSLLRDDQGEPLYFISHIQDITERKQEHAALFEARRLAEVTLEAIGEGVIRVDALGLITDINTAACSLLGVCEQALVGEPFERHVLFHDPDRDRRLPDPLAGVLRDGERVRVPIFTRLQRLDGSFISIVDSISPIHDENGAIAGAVFVFQDISDARRMTDELTHQARHDALTGLPNRRGFEDALTLSWQRLRASKLPTFVMYLDLDHFKTVNDTCGHAAGDELLRQISVKFRAALRESDVLARLGGDEFAVIIHAKDAHGAQVVADKLIRAARDLGFSFNQRRYAVGVSIGIAALTPDIEATATVLMHADAALYIAKDMGRNRYHVYQADHEQGAAAAYMGTAQLLQSGLEQNLFTLYLQAIVDTTGRRIGYEALLRFDGPDGVIAPDHFLPTAKRLGMMSRIDRWVVTAALDLVAAYERRGLWPAETYLSINISPVSLADPQFHAELITLLDQRRPQAQRFVFEITESDALFGEHYPKLIQNLRQRGFRVWLDDFASGYNSFDMLKRAAVDGLKIDRSFVTDLQRDPINRAVIRSIGDVSRALHLGVIAEGVETVEVLELLTKAGVERFQGYLFHRPEPAETALADRGYLIAGC
ncbi:EAL domain-containing protein [Salinisphaera sp. T31B1]|uniref:PAS domain-containing protein n=1 Tax=Salinisphaera sp. T31B1 TaxID=727963 RepID=UPI00333F92E9